MAVFGAAADPLAVPDQKVTQLSAGVKLIQDAICKIRPGHEFKAHFMTAFSLKLFTQLHQSICRIPGGPA